MFHSAPGRPHGNQRGDLIGSRIMDMRPCNR